MSNLMCVDWKVELKYMTKIKCEMELKVEIWF